jgi:hypothetical protein
VKELINNYQDKRGFWRKATAMAGVWLSLTACDQQLQITDGTIYQKEHITTYSGSAFGKIPYRRQEIEKEAVLTPPTYEEKGPDEARMSRLHPNKVENWKVYIAQCPTEEIRPVERIEKECKINAFDVPQEVFPALKIGQYADFKQSK